ncbi:hypothetical protein [Sedimentimonas flavescens]|uniref:hypothetical protein n=1 Tax=Sedimentimonas flavescens TaxID=2851012 RepID=UPI001C4A6800|nr:hypothetical protein [Sedimentimonas flavescens]MBW0157652.1 hypothetical protein [Sedimentimonas flavescens]
MILFGLRSPLVVDYEIAATRSGTDIAYGVSVAGHPRVLSDIEIVELAALGDRPRGAAMPSLRRISATISERLDQNRAALHP